MHEYSKGTTKGLTVYKLHRLHIMSVYCFRFYFLLSPLLFYVQHQHYLTTGEDSLSYGLAAEVSMQKKQDAAAASCPCSSTYNCCKKLFMKLGFFWYSFFSNSTSPLAMGMVLRKQTN